VYEEEADSWIAETTLENISRFERGQGVIHNVTAEMLA